MVGLRDFEIVSRGFGWRASEGSSGMSDSETRSRSRSERSAATPLSNTNALGPKNRSSLDSLDEDESLNDDVSF